MPSMYVQLVERLGIEGAKEEMRRRRSLVKKPGFASMDKAKRRELSLRGVDARKKRSQDQDPTKG